MNHRGPPLLASILLVLLPFPLACDSSSPPPEPSVVVSGMVEFVNIEGGCFVFHADDGNDYNLFAEPHVGLGAVLEHGAFLEVEIRSRPDLGGFCPGRIVEVLRILAASLPLSQDDLWLLREDIDGVIEWRLLDGSGR